MSDKKLKLGVFGFGAVGQGLYHVLHKTKGVEAEILKICVKDKNKKRPLADRFFTFDKEELLNNPEVNVIVELIDDAEAAMEIVRSAVKNGKAVVSANKKMIAENFEEIFELQQKYKVPILYEASCCASIPIIRNLEEYYDNDMLNAVEGIFNGSTNYILSKLILENLSFDKALQLAQENGFAETDPTLDVEGFDPKYKLCIIIAHAFGLMVEPENIYNLGITKLSDFDIQYASEKGYAIKLVAKCQKVENKIHALVAPQFVKKDNPLSQVEFEFNGVMVESAFAEKQLFVGKGAGSYPTGSAVLSDISALRYDYKYEYRKHFQNGVTELSDAFQIKVFVSYPKGLEGIKEAFDSISEHYESEGINYFIGDIKLKNLTESTWINEKGVSVVLTPDSNLKS